MRKKLYFAAPFPKILFTKDKHTTFRVIGGERYNKGDELSLCYLDDIEFATAVVEHISHRKKKFRNLSKKDWEGHEKFISKEIMYDIYSNWNGFRVGPNTAMHVITYGDFKLTGPIRCSRHYGLL